MAQVINLRQLHFGSCNENQAVGRRSGDYAAKKLL